MSVKPIPTGFHTLTPYLAVNGASKLIDFLKRAFDAQENYCSKAPDGSVMHAQLKIKDSMLMVSDANGAFPAMPSFIYMYVENTDKVYNQAMQAGAISIMEPADQFYGDRNAGVKDPAGNMWWIATHIEDVSEEELKKRAAALRK